MNIDNDGKYSLQEIRAFVWQGIIRGGLVLIFMGIGLYFEAQKQDVKSCRSLLAATIIATAISAFSVLYDCDRWSLKKKLLIHTICMFIFVIPALFLSGWYDLSTPAGYFSLFGSFIVSGVIFASIGYLVSRFILKNVPGKGK